MKASKQFRFDVRTLGFLALAFGTFFAFQNFTPTQGSKSATTTLSLPPTIVSLGLQKDPYVLAGYLDVTHYGAKGDGVTDDTAAFQQAMLEASGSSITGASGASMVVYVPAHTYLISGTLTGYQTFNGRTGNTSQTKFGAIGEGVVGENGILAPSLVGPASGPRPVIKLAAGTFTDSSKPQPMIYLVNTPNCNTLYTNQPCGTKFYPDVGNFGEMFNAVIRDIDVTTGNNPGAIGIKFYSAQMSYMQNVMVDATGGYAGIQGAPATETWTNIEVNGGQYGIIIDRTGGMNTIAGLKLENQTLAGLNLQSTGGTTVVGFAINETSTGATSVMTSEGVAQGILTTLIDGSINTASSSVAAIVNGLAGQGSGGLYLSNVYIQTPKFLIQNGSTSIASSGAVQYIDEYSHADSGNNNVIATTTNGWGYAQSSFIVINDQEQQSDFRGPSFGISKTAPTDLIIRHLPGQMPWAFDSNAYWVTDFGADSTGATDSTAAIQSAINAAGPNGEVFLPRGEYSISSTLNIPPNMKFFGLPGGYSQLLGFTWVTHNTYQPYLHVGNFANQAAATKAGTAVVSDINIFLPVDTTQCQTCVAAGLVPANYNPVDQTYLYAIDWEVGQSSVMNQVYETLQDTSAAVSGEVSRSFVQVQNGGGGRWYGFQHAGGYDNSNDHVILVSNNSTPLTLYGSNPEHGGGASFYLFSNSSNIRVLGMKAEDGPSYWVDVESSNNIMLAGLNGDGTSPIETHNSTNINFNTLGYYGDKYAAQGYGGRGYITDDTKTYSFLDIYPLFKIGSFSANPFPYCGDKICDGGETAQNCPADCSGGAPAPSPSPAPAPAPAPAPVPSPTPPPGISPDGSTLLSTSTGSLVTQYGTWTFASGGSVLLNGKQVGTSTSELFVLNNGAMYALAVGSYYLYNGTAWVSVASLPPGPGAASCTFNNSTIASGSPVTAYQASTVAYGSSCVSQVRTCTNGTLSGTYAFANCTVTAPASCTFNTSTIASGSPVTAYQASTVAYGSSCVSQVRTCTNGTLSGTYAYSTCTVAAAPSAAGSINPNPAAQGQTVNVKVSANPNLTATGAMVVINFKNSAGTLLGSATATGISFTTGQATVFSAPFTVPAKAPQVSYSATATIYSDSTGTKVIGTLPVFATLTVN